MLFRHVLGRLNFGVFYDEDGGGGGGGGAEPAEPSYELPSEVARADTQPQEPPAELPAGEAPPEPPVEQIPKYRLDEAIQQRDYYQGIIEHQQAQIAALMQRMAPQQPPEAQPAAPQLTEQDIKIRDRLYAVIPELRLLGELRDLVQHREAILGAAQAVPAWQSAETQYWDRYAENSHQAIGDAAAAHLLGPGKTTKDLNGFQRSSLRSAFIQWVTSDPGRAMRYEREDPSLPKEFWGAYRAAVYDPLRREGQATLLNQQPPRIPQGGGGAPAAGGHPPAQRPPAAPADDEDAIHSRAWAMRDTVAPR